MVYFDTNIAIYTLCKNIDDKGFKKLKGISEIEILIK